MHEQTADEVFGQALWIGRGQTVGDWRAVVRPAPMLRRRFELPADARELTLHVCGLGYHELYLDSQRIGDRVLEPVVTQYDKRVAYVTHQLPGVLPAGRHMLGVILGNGW
jgi:alpha-L-rhamnosidase